MHLASDFSAMSSRSVSIAFFWNMELPVTLHETEDSGSFQFCIVLGKLQVLAEISNSQEYEGMLLAQAETLHQ